MQVKAAKKTLAQEVTTFQINKGYSLGRLAKTTKVSARTLERIMNGKSNPHLATIVRLSNAGVFVGNLLG